MTNTQWEQLSVQAIAVVAVVYFLAFLAHLVEWASLRRTEAPVPVAAGGVDLGDVEAEGADELRLQRAAVFGRFGVLLTVIGAVVQFVGLVGRGMAADPNRVPWMLGSTPVDMGLRNVADISGTRWLGCAVSSGAVWCYGDNGLGQLGNGTEATSGASFVPVRVSGIG